jgi:hypothetical protein
MRRTVPSTEQGETSNQGLSRLTSAIFDEEQQRLDAAAEEAVTLPDDLLPGVGGKGMRLSEGLREIGIKIFKGEQAALMRRLDEDKDGLIAYEELYNALRSV